MIILFNGTIYQFFCVIGYENFHDVYYEVCVAISARKELSKLWNIPFNLAKMVGHNKGHDMWGWVQTHYKRNQSHQGLNP
jgi:hypothetical protein